MFRCIFLFVFVYVCLCKCQWFGVGGVGAAVWACFGHQYDPTLFRSQDVSYPSAIFDRYLGKILKWSRIFCWGLPLATFTLLLLWVWLLLASMPWWCSHPQVCFGNLCDSQVCFCSKERCAYVCLLRCACTCVCVCLCVEIARGKVDKISSSSSEHCTQRKVWKGPSSSLWEGFQLGGELNRRRKWI